MTGKTHLTVGTAVAIAAAHPHSLTTLCLCAAAGAVGSVVSDVDVDSSQSHKGLVRLCAVLAATILALAGAEQLWQVGLVARLQAQTSLMRAVPGGLLFLLVCWYGMHQPHRSFMHSALALAILTALAYTIAPVFALPFGAGMASHIVLDLLNRKHVHLLYPLRKGWSLDLCSADGWVNHWLFLGGAGLLLLELGLFLLYFFQ